MKEVRTSPVAFTRDYTLALKKKKFTYSFMLILIELLCYNMIDVSQATLHLVT